MHFFKTNIFIWFLLLTTSTPCLAMISYPVEVEECERYAAATRESQKAADQIFYNQRVSAARILNLIAHDPMLSISAVTLKLLQESPGLVGVLTQAQIYVDLPELSDSSEKARLYSDLVRIRTYMNIATGFVTVLWDASTPELHLTTTRLVNQWKRFHSKNPAEDFDRMQLWNETHRDWMLENYHVFRSGKPPRRLELSRSPRRIGIITCASSEEEVQRIKASLLSWIKYAIDFGYETTTIQISDDSPASMASKVQSVLEDLRKLYPGFGFKYFGLSEKQAYRTKLVQALMSSAHFEKIKEQLGGGINKKIHRRHGSDFIPKSRPD